MRCELRAEGMGAGARGGGILLMAG